MSIPIGRAGSTTFPCPCCNQQVTTGQYSLDCPQCDAPLRVCGGEDDADRVFVEINATHKASIPNSNGWVVGVCPNADHT